MGVRAEVAETVLTAFTGHRKAEHVTARLIVRRVRLNPKHDRVVAHPAPPAVALGHVLEEAHSGK